MIDPSISVTFHEDYRYPFQTWAVGTRVDGEKRYAVMTCMPARNPGSGASASDWSVWDNLRAAASDGLAALLMADTPEALAKLFDGHDSRYVTSFEIGAYASTPAEIRWPELLAIVERVGNYADLGERLKPVEKRARANTLREFKP